MNLIVSSFKNFSVFLCFIFLLFALCFSSPLQANTTNKEYNIILYTTRNPSIVQPVADLYASKQNKTILVHYFATYEELVAAYTNPDSQTPADILLSMGVSSLVELADIYAAFQPLKSPILTNNIPAHLRSAGNTWFAFSCMPLGIAYNTNTVNPAEIVSYSDLATSYWEEKLIQRMDNSYHRQDFIAWLTVNIGSAETVTLLTSMRKNLITDPIPTDVLLLSSLEANIGNVAIVGVKHFLYYKQTVPKTKLGFVWSTLGKAGIYTNISGAGVTATAKNPQEAQAFLEWLSLPENQTFYVQLTYELPASPVATPPQGYTSLPPVRLSEVPMEHVGRAAQMAFEIIDIIQNPHKR